MFCQTALFSKGSCWAAAGTLRWSLRLSCSRPGEERESASVSGMRTGCSGASVGCEKRIPEPGKQRERTGPLHAPHFVFRRAQKRTSLAERRGCLSKLPLPGASINQAVGGNENSITDLLLQIIFVSHGAYGAARGGGCAGGPSPGVLLAQPHQRDRGSQKDVGGCGLFSPS